MADERARQLRSHQTNAERVLWKELRELKKDGFHFRRQAPIGLYIADFACHSAKLVVEVDGGQHGMDLGVAKDKKRTAWLEGQGYRVLRFWNDDVMKNIEGVMQIVCSRLSSR